MILDFFKSLVSPVTNTIEKINTNKTEIKKRHIDRIVNAEDKLAEWELVQAESGQHSWKDEFWTIILAIPLILCFFPDYVPMVQEGFKALETMPTFYQYWLGVAILTSFGIRAIKR
jgi:hypothetical protein